jgi:hypothetical protein
MSQTTKNKIFSYLFPMVFNRGFAEEYGIAPAILFSHLQSLADYCVDEQKCKIDDKIWVKKSIKDLQSSLSFFTESEIKNALETLLELKIISRMKISESSDFDHTYWYAIEEIS